MSDISIYKTRVARIEADRARALEACEPKARMELGAVANVAGAVAAKVAELKAVVNAGYDMQFAEANNIIAPLQAAADRAVNAAELAYTLAVYPALSDTDRPRFEAARAFIREHADARAVENLYDLATASGDVAVMAAVEQLTRDGVAGDTAELGMKVLRQRTARAAPAKQALDDARAAQVELRTALREAQAPNQAHRNEQVVNAKRESGAYRM